MSKKQEQQTLKRLGKRIRELRKQRRISGKPLSQEALGGVLSVEQSVISKLERGETALSIRRFVLLAQFFNISLSELFDGV